MNITERSVPKLQKETPEQRSQRQDRNKALKREYHPELYQDRPVKGAASEDDRFRLANSSLRTVSKDRLEANGGRICFTTFDFSRDPAATLESIRLRRSPRPWRRPGARHDWTKTPKARAKLRKVGERAKRVAAADADWRRQVRAVWETCLITGAREGLQAHHCYPKQAHPDKRHLVWNGLLLAAHIHDLIHRTPGAMEAGQLIADEIEAAAAGRRPPVTRNQVRRHLFEKVPILRKHAKEEES